MKRLMSGLSNTAASRRHSRDDSAGKRIFDADGNFAAYCSSYSRHLMAAEGRRDSTDSQALMKFAKKFAG